MASDSEGQSTRSLQAVSPSPHVTATAAAAAVGRSSEQQATPAVEVDTAARREQRYQANESSYIDAEDIDVTSAAAALVGGWGVTQQENTRPPAAARNEAI